MKTFKVCLTRDITESAVVEVRAKDEDEAYDLAMEMAGEVDFAEDFAANDSCEGVYVSWMEEELMKTKVVVAIYEYRNGMGVRVFDSWEKAQTWKDEIGADEWARVSDDPQPEDACGDEYFDLVDGEWFYVEECEVE